jgi:hypothetical protein
VIIRKNYIEDKGGGGVAKNSKLIFEGKATCVKGV